MSSPAPALTQRQKAQRAKAKAKRQARAKARAAARAKAAAARAQARAEAAAARQKARADAAAARQKARAEAAAARAKAQAEARAQAEAAAAAKAAAAAAAAAKVGAQPTVPAMRTSGDLLRVANANIKVLMSATDFATDLAKATGTLPDAITLNEVNSRSAAQLTPPGYAHYRPAQARLKANAVMWRTDRWTPVSQGYRVIVEDGPMQYDKNRGATWVTLEGKNGEGRISLVSTHHMQNPAKFLKATRVERQALYTQGMVRLRELVSTLAPQGPVFVGGDFNSGFREFQPWSPRTMLAPIGMRAAMEVMGHQKTHDDGGSIDYVFFQDGLAQPLVQSVTDLRSDHHLMIYDFRLLGSPLAPAPHPSQRR